MKVKISRDAFVAAANVEGTLGQNNLGVAEFVRNHYPAFVYMEITDADVMTDTMAALREEEAAQEVVATEPPEGNQDVVATEPSELKEQPVDMTNPTDAVASAETTPVESETV